MQALKTGETIRALRKNRNITQEQLAEVLGVSTAAISKWETGITYPDIQMLPILARFFRVSIDFLMGFSNMVSEEERQQIYKEVSDSFQTLPYDEAILIWEYYIKQHLNDDVVKFELSSILMNNLAMLLAAAPDKANALITKLIHAYKQCLDSDDLTIKQGSYYQIGNLYIALQNYDMAEQTLSQIPVPKINPQLLLNMIYVSKGEYSTAKKSIQESVLNAINEIIGEFGHLITISRDTQDFDSVISLFHMQQNLLEIFDLSSTLGTGVTLQLSEQLCSLEKYDEALSEMKGFIKLTAKQDNRKGICNIPHFSDVDISKLSIVPDGLKATYKILIDSICISLNNCNSDEKSEIIQQYKICCDIE